MTTFLKVTESTSPIFMKPRIFIASSSERLDVANAVRCFFASKAEVSIWNQGVFLPSATTIEALFRQVKKSDFALFVFHPSDTSVIKTINQPSVRDNVIFELGLFAGALGRDRCFAIKPNNTEMRIPSDLLGVCIPSYEYNEESEIDASIKPACTQLWQAICNSLENTPLFLARYVAQEEPVLGDKHDSRINVERAYNILLYMFRFEVFESFCAFDLAFHRWEEILGSNPASSGTERVALGQALNISSEILDACDSLFERNGCKSFRRILVIDTTTLEQPNSDHILTRLHDTETLWRSKWPGLDVETRILKWNRDRNPATRKRIAQLHDFAIFESENQNLAIVETTLTAPTDTPANSECDIRTDAEYVSRLRKAFDKFWDVEAKPIDQVLNSTRRQAKVSTLIINQTSPALQARDYFLQHRYDLRSPCALFIEAGYFDQRTPEDRDRFEHIQDANWLRNEINSLLPTVRDRILMETFINNFSEQQCGFDCPIPPIRSEEISAADQWRAHLQTSQEFEGIGDDWELFFMKETRNRFIRYLKGLIDDDHSTITTDDIDSPGQILANTKHGKVVVAHFSGDGKNRIIARCAGLMAQHYYDLFCNASQRIPELQELWIFDFNRSSEALAVNHGAAVAATIFPWNKGFRLKIVNAIYPAGISDDSSLWTLTIP